MLLIPANIFQPLIDVFEALLKAIHGVVGGSWGWSIVILTVLVRAVLIPLTHKQMHSMQRMQAHMPQLNEIQTKSAEITGAFIPADDSDGVVFRMNGIKW